MKHLTLSDLLLGIEHMFTKEAPLLALLQSVVIYRSQLESLRDQISALIARATPKGAPFAQELREADSVHDRSAEASRMVLEAHALSPLTPPALRDAATRVLDELIPSSGDLRRAYIDEVQAARACRAKLPSYADDLRRFPTADGGTLLDWMTAYLDAADLIYDLLQRRIQALSAHKDLLAIDASIGGTALRVSAIKTLSRLRKTLRDEVSLRLDLPPSTEARLFGMFDLLQSVHD